MPNDSPIDPYNGPTSLDAELDARIDPWSLERVVGVDMARGRDETGVVICRRQGRAPNPLAGAPTPGLSKKAQGEVDRKKLKAALADPDIKDKPREDFGDMLDRIDPQYGDYPCLTDRQRGYVDNVLDELGIDAEDPAERNAAVPRGKEVAPAWNAKLPLAPPGRELAAARRGIPQSRCAKSIGGVAVDCLACGGDCPW